MPSKNLYHLPQTLSKLFVEMVDILVCGSTIGAILHHGEWLSPSLEKGGCNCCYFHQRKESIP